MNMEQGGGEREKRTRAKISRRISIESEKTHHHGSRPEMARKQARANKDRQLTSINSGLGAVK
jgi:hypothetical protein